MTPKKTFTPALLFFFCVIAVAPISARGGGAVESSISVSPQAAAAVIPDTFAGRRLAATVRALNDGSPEVLTKFLAENYAASALAQRSVAARAPALANIHRNTRGFEVRRIVNSSDMLINVLAQDRIAGDWYRLSIEVEPEAPYGMLGFGSRPIPAPPGAGGSGKLSDEQISQQLGEYLQKLVDADLFSGAVLVTRNGTPVFSNAYGMASRSFQAPNRLDTKFNLGSMNKMFTAVAIAQLVEQGKLSFTDTVGKIIPDYPNKEVAAQVTVHHLLTHTSGMGSYFNRTYFEGSKDRWRRVADYAPLYVNEPLAFAPGDDWEYSNSGFMLLGAIIEKVSGQDYFAFVRENIYKPAGMTNTDAYEMDRDTPNLAIGYTMNSPGVPLPPGQRKNNLYMHVVKGGPAGGGFSTVEDLQKFAAALRGNRLLSAKMTETVMTGKLPTDLTDPDSKYGYGFFDNYAGGVRVAGHSGGFPGINANLDIYLGDGPGAGYTVAILANYDPPAATRVADRVRSLILQR